MLDLVAIIEAKIEFEETDRMDSDSTFCDSKLRNLTEELEKVVSDSYIYERIKNGFKALIYGPPNSGKSSLMNYLGIIARITSE